MCAIISDSRSACSHFALSISLSLVASTDCKRPNSGQIRLNILPKKKVPLSLHINALYRKIDEWLVVCILVCADIWWLILTLTIKNHYEGAEISTVTRITLTVQLRMHFKSVKYHRLPMHTLIDFQCTSAHPHSDPRTVSFRCCTSISLLSISSFNWSFSVFSSLICGST